MAEKQYSLSELKEMREALGFTEKNDPASTTLYTPTLQGPYQGSTTQFGLFTYPGVRPDRFSAMARPYSFAQALGAPLASDFYEEILSVLLGVTTASGTNAETWCDDPPEVGYGKECKQAFYWGSYHVKTELNAIPEIGQLRNRSDIPGQVMPGFSNPEMRNPLVPDLFYRLTDTRSQLAYELWRLGVEFERTIDVVAVAGDNTQAYTATEHGWTQEPAGIDGMIKTGYTDVKTSQVCAAMDSVVITFGADVGATIPSEPAASQRNITIAISELVRAVKNRARKMGYGPNVSWYFLMREEAFHRVVEEYSCGYATYRCTSTNAGQPFNTDTTATNQLRLQMMAGQYLLVDGVPVPVVFSEGIPQTNSSGTFTSDIYLIPDTWNGRKLTYLQYFPMDNPYATEFRTFADADDITILNNGLWIAGVNSTGLCKEYEFGTKMRLIMETPFLAGRLDNVSYYFTTEIRNALPGSSFYADGPGNTVYKP
jgi:hypothetical protein